MRYCITIRARVPRQPIEDRLHTLTIGGPFLVRNLASAGGGAWSFTLQPSRPGMAVGFGKVAELLVLVAREFEVEAVEGSAPGALAAAS